MDRFIVGSGRCGSTLLSRMLAEDDDLLSVFEFFNGLDMGRRFAPSLSGAELAELLGAEQPFVTAVLRRGYTAEEIVYPFGRPGARYSLSDPLPWLCVTMMPRLSDEPDRLYDAILDWARRQPERPAAEHYRALFEWLCETLGRRRWVERSGSSIDYLAELHERFPEARFLHIHRDGREVALSMREHDAYRLPIALLYDAPVASGRRVSELGGFDPRAAPRADDVISQILASRPPPEYFGRYWSDQLRRGATARAAIDPARYRAIRFEELVRDPVLVLREVAAFLELPVEGGWVDRAAALVRGRPPLRFPGLSPSEQAALEEACRPGFEALGAPSG